MVGEAGLFPVTVTNTGSALLLHSQKSSLEEHARVLVCPCVAPRQVLYLLQVFSSDRVTNRGFEGKCCCSCLVAHLGFLKALSFSLHSNVELQLV